MRFKSMISNELEIKTVKFVLSPCLFDNKENVHGFDMKRCQLCEYFIKPNRCVYEESEQDLSCETRVSDVFYYKTMKCANCGHKISVNSAYEELHKGERDRCIQCGTLHTFIEVRNKKCIFAVPAQK